MCQHHAGPIHLDKNSAALYLDITKDVLRGFRHRNIEPAYYRISPKKVLYRQNDLDAWRASWVRVEPGKPATA